MNSDFYRTMIRTDSPRRVARDCFWMLIGGALLAIGMLLASCTAHAQGSPEAGDGDRETSSDAGKAAVQPTSADPRPTTDVTRFGAIADDKLDDTAAFQAAIDSVPVLNPDGAQGGTVFVPRGTWLISSLRLPPAVQLIGEGDGSYLIGSGELPTVRLWSPFGHGFVIGAAVRDLKIFSPTSDCIGFDRPTVKGNLVNCRFENLSLKSGGGHYAVDLVGGLAGDRAGEAGGLYSQDCVLRNVKVRNFGGGAVRINGNANLIDRVNTEGSDDDPRFACEPARVVVTGGGNTISGCIIEGGGKPAVAYHVKGTFTWIGNWAETTRDADGVAYRFVNASGQVDTLKLLASDFKASFVNCPAMQIGRLDFRSSDDRPASSIVLDGTSNVTVDLAITQRDCGWLDHDRFRIRQVLNEAANIVLDNPPQPRSGNLLRNPNLSKLSVNGKATPEAYWFVSDTTAQGRKCEFAVKAETTAGGERALRIDVKSNPDRHNLLVRVELAVPTEFVGKPAVLQVTCDPFFNLWTKGFEKNLPLRMSGERTMTPIPQLHRDDEIYLIVDSPAAGSTLRISGLSVTR